ncbi:MAG: alpha/beta fold hydrolase [Dehalococcoidia bacterium]
MLLHGITAAATSWSGVAALLSQRRRVIAFDARGHGDSDWSPDEAYAADDHFADLVVALDAAGVERCVLVGFSMGGAVATMYAATRSERTAGLVIVDAYPAPELSTGSRRVAETLAALYRGGALPGSFDPAIARRMAADLDAGEARRLDLWPLWETISVPALIVRGALSDVLTAQTAQEMLSRQPTSRLVTIPGVGHQIPSQRPRELAAAITSLRG